MKSVMIAVLLGVVALAASQSFNREDVGAWHFHTYFFEVNPNRVREAEEFRAASRQMIDSGLLGECSLNQIFVGWDGPHPVSQWEMCCNRTSYATAHAWHVQNHGNLSVLVHPLTIHDLEDHLSRVSWIGSPVVIDDECPCLYPELPIPRPCPVYPRYSDVIPESKSLDEYEIPLPGTEDYKGLRKNFNILTDKY